MQVAAISDVNPEYTGSCGRCYELRCAGFNFSVSSCITCLLLSFLEPFVMPSQS